MCDNYAIHQSCENGHLEVAKWLKAGFGITAEDVKSEDFAAFIGSCSSGHLDVAMWVADTFAVTDAEARAQSSEALRNALVCDHDHVVVWLVERFGMDVDDMNSVDDPNLELSHRKVLEHVIQHGASVPVNRKSKCKHARSCKS